MIDAAYAAALDALLGSINKSTGISHPNDLARAIEVFGRLLISGRAAGHPDQIGEYLVANGLAEADARDVQLVYSSLDGHVNGTGGPWFADKFHADLLNKR